MSVNLSNITILKFENLDCHCVITRISKSEAIKLLHNLTEKKKSIIKNKHPKQF